MQKLAHMKYLKYNACFFYFIKYMKFVIFQLVKQIIIMYAREL
jgi:hypothetical protein